MLACAAEAAATSDDAILPAVVNTLAVLTFRDQIRPDARETLDYFREEGVELKVISGDDPRKVAAIGPGRSIAAAGQTVARTGVGVNDVQAWKEADIGIAMNSAASATKAAAAR